MGSSDHTYLPEDSPLVTEAAVHDALRRFQSQHALKPTGKFDDASLSALVEEHGS